jgi:hypothetical protein
LEVINLQKVAMSVLRYGACRWKRGKPLHVAMNFEKRAEKKMYRCPKILLRNVKKKPKSSLVNIFAVFPHLQFT